MKRTKRAEYFKRVATVKEALRDTPTDELERRLGMGILTKEGSVATRATLAARSTAAGFGDPAAVEEAIVAPFVVPHRRARYLDGLANSKKRSRVLGRLDHHLDDLDPRYRHPIPNHRQSAADVAELLSKRGAPENCFIVSTWKKFDRRSMSLREALSGLVGEGMGSIISCIPGVLGYYEGEEPGERWILERRAGY